MEHGLLQDLTVSILTQLAMQAPALLVCLVGLVASVILWKRYPGPCLCAFLGTGLILATRVAITFVQLYLLHFDGMDFWHDRHFGGPGFFFEGLQLIGSMLQGGGYALLLLGIFLGRARAARIEKQFFQKPMHE